jgi:hypothetical protein
VEREKKDLIMQLLGIDFSEEWLKMNGWQDPVCETLPSYPKSNNSKLEQ